MNLSRPNGELSCRSNDLLGEKTPQQIARTKIRINGSENKDSDRFILFSLIRVSIKMVAVPIFPVHS